MSGKFERTAALLGAKSMEVLSKSSVLICGIGGVGSFAAEAAARSGVGNITLIDSDIIDITNINRQLHATVETVGQYKTEVMKARIAAINPECNAKSIIARIDETNADVFVREGYSYVVDAIDSVDCKVALIRACKQSGTRVISSMGAANKIMPDMFEIADIYSTSVDPLARVMRGRLRSIGIDSLKVCFSRENPLKPDGNGRILGSMCFVTATCGLLIAGEVVRDLTSERLPGL